MFYMMLKGMKPDPSMMCNGMLAGLVAITAPCAFVDTLGAVIIGAIAGVLVVVSVFFWDKMRRRRLGRRHLGPRRQRPVGRDLGRHVRQRQVRRRLERRRPRRDASKQATASATASAACSTATPRSFIAQLLDAAVVAVFGFVMAYVWFKFSNLITPIRVSQEVELEGLDVPGNGSAWVIRTSP